MSAGAVQGERILRRMLANGHLTGWPARPEDQALLLRLATGRFEAGREYREPEVNEVLRAWLATFCAPYGIDHVTFRRGMVDARLLLRDKAGTAYSVVTEGIDAGERRLDPAAVMEQARAEREARKRLHRPE